MDSAKMAKVASYKDLIKNFHQAESSMTAR